MQQGRCANVSTPSLSRDQFNQSGSANGKIAPAMLLPLTAKQTLPNFNGRLSKGHIKLFFSPLQLVQLQRLGYPVMRFLLRK